MIIIRLTRSNDFLLANWKDITDPAVTPHIGTTEEKEIQFKNRSAAEKWLVDQGIDASRVSNREGKLEVNFKGATQGCPAMRARAQMNKSVGVGNVRCYPSAYTYIPPQDGYYDELMDATNPPPAAR